SKRGYEKACEASGCRRDEQMRCLVRRERALTEALPNRPKLLDGGPRLLVRGDCFTLDDRRERRFFGCGSGRSVGRDLRFYRQLAEDAEEPRTAIVLQIRDQGVGLFLRLALRVRGDDEPHLALHRADLRPGLR